MFKCQEASQLTSAEFDRTLSFSERLRLGLHRLICGPCRLYRRQMALLRAQVERLAKTHTTTTLDDAARARIRARLRAPAE